MSDEIERQKSEISRQYEDLQRKANFSDLQLTLTETSTNLTGLPERIKTLRDRGYAFANYLESKAQTLADQWQQLEGNAQEAIRLATRRLSSDMESVEESYTNYKAAAGMAAAIHLQKLEPALQRIKTEVESAEKKIQSTFGEVPNNVRQTINQLRTIEGYLDLIEEATFQLAAGESIFMAVKAEWTADRDKPDGVFYLTDRRILMEQKEKVGGFLGFGGEKKQQILWEAPLGTIEDVTHENKGLLGGIDLIHITFSSGGPFANTTIEVKGGIRAEAFAAQVRRAASGGLENERGLKLDQEVVDAIVDAPTSCGVCGASFDQHLIKGINEVRCNYCGATTRIAI